MTGNQNRRDFCRLAAVGLTGATALAQPVRAAGVAGTPKRLTLGMASYTFRKFSLDQTLSMTKRLGLEKIAFKSMHLPLESSPDEIRAAVEKAKAAGLDVYGCGVVYMKSEAEVQQAFDYAKAAGMRMIIGVPTHELLDAAEARVKQYGISLAIHNHGPGDKLYPTPESVYERIKKRDPRIGLCIDVGHTKRAGQDPAAAFLAFRDRVLDIHVKDVSAGSAQGRTLEIGRGVIDTPALLDTLVKHKYTGVVALEYEKDENDPLAGSAESIGFLRGVLATL